MCNPVWIYCSTLTEAAQKLTKVKEPCMDKKFNSWFTFFYFLGKIKACK